MIISLLFQKSSGLLLDRICSAAARVKCSCDYLGNIYSIVCLFSGKVGAQYAAHGAGRPTAIPPNELPGLETNAAQ